MDTNRLSILLARYMDGSLTNQEFEQLTEAAETLSEGEWQQLLTPLMSATTATERYNAEEWEPSIQRILAARIKQPSAPVHRIHFLKTAWFKYAAAIIILFGIGAYLWNTQEKKNQDIVSTKPSAVKKEILPGYNRAVLTLSDGKKVELDSAASETINDGTLSIKNNNGQLLYSDVDAAGPGPNEAMHPGSLPADAAYNTMSTPKGGQYQLTLSDGTKVWLNAASSITYPIAFTGKTREVSITGEAYFEVAKNPRQPFHVKTHKEQITVLGTSFNVNSYLDEPVSKTSLIEGSIKIQNQILKPGQAFTDGKIATTNIDQDIAWKNGFFNFDNTALPSMLRQLSRWYDIEILYKNKVPDLQFEGRVRRDLKLSEVLRLLNALDVKYEVKEKTLYIL